ncbi:MAG: hypothetical protein QF893_13680 [Alphaproteobacteria bacterium]|nr:hypothetical protein [Alphaproteobacteria bacterium]
MEFAVESTYEVEAYNSAKTSDNKIHDDDVARQFGFAGGLVPGVDVYAYMAHAPVARWGRDWLARGAMTARFIKPVYEGETARVVARPGADDALEIVVESRGERCASGTATLPKATPTPPSPAAFPHRPLPERKPQASPGSLAADTVLGAYDCVHASDEAPGYLADVREDLTLYAEEGLVHPGFMLRLANWVLRENVLLGPWIHVESRVQNFRAAEVDRPLSTRGCVTANYERKGHKFVELEVLALGRDEAPLMAVTHTAIYAPRQVAGAGA